MVHEVTLRSGFDNDYADIVGCFRIVAPQSRDLELARTWVVLGELVMDVARSRRRDGRVDSDIMGIIMRSPDREQGGPLSDPQLAGEVLTLVVAGHETTAIVPNWIGNLLATHVDFDARPAAEVRVNQGNAQPQFDEFADFIFTRQVIDEALRVYPSLWLMTRKTVADDWLGACHVPAGTEISLSSHLTQRHPRFRPAPVDSSLVVSQTMRGTVSIGWRCALSAPGHATA